MSKKINIQNYFECVSAFDYKYDKYTATELSFGKNIKINTGTQNEYILSNYDIIIFSVGLNSTAQQIRKELYSLAFFDKKINIIDLGNLKINNSDENIYTLREALLEVKSEVKSIIVIGDNKNLLQGIYNTYEFEDKLVNIAEISSIINFVSPEYESNSGDLNKILLNENHTLFHYINLGYQSHYNHIKTIDLLNNLGFEAHRFGLLKNDITTNEYLLRDADIVSIDMSAVSYFDAPDVKNQTPNGFSAHDICQIAYYAGISDNSEVFSISELIGNLTDETITTKLTAQIIWYYISGFNARYNDNPFSEDNKYKKISVAIAKNDTSIIFYNNTINNRWWFQVEPRNSKIAISCSEKDYTETLNGNIPLRWIKFDNK